MSDTEQKDANGNSGRWLRDSRWRWMSIVDGRYELRRLIEEIKHEYDKASTAA